MQSQKEKSYHVTIDSLETETFLTVDTQYYVLAVTLINQLETTHHYPIRRRYSDFELLFRALNVCYPGYILPYFPPKSIKIFLSVKMRIGEKQEKEVTERKQELQEFIQAICNHSILNKSHELSLFLGEDSNFKGNKSELESVIKKNSFEESMSLNLLFGKGMSWVNEWRGQVGNPPEKEPQEGHEKWISIVADVHRWKSCLGNLSQCFSTLSSLKTEEKDWGSGSTEIDIFEKLRAKVVSSRGYNQELIDAIEKEVLSKLETEGEKMGQIIKQLQQRQSISSALSWQKSKQGVAKIKKKRDQFEDNFERDWKLYLASSGEFVRKVSGNFTTIWSKYQQQALRIWK